MSFLLLIVLAKFILPADYGELSLFNTVVSFLNYFIALSTTGYESISYFQKSRDEFRYDYTSIHIIGTIVLIIFSIVLLFFGSQLSHILSLSLGFLWIAVLISYTGIYSTMVLSYYRISQQVKKYGIYSCGNAILNFILSLILVIALAQGWKGRVYSHLSCNLLFAFIAVLIYHKSGLVRFSSQTKGRFRSIILWGLPLIPHMAALWVRQGLDRYIIDAFHSKADVGLFSFALNLTNIIVIIGSSFNNSFSVDIYQALSSGKAKESIMKSLVSRSKKIAIFYVISAIAVVIGCSILVPLVLPAYSNSLPYFWILSLYGLIQCMYFLVVNYLFYFKRNKEIMFTTFGTSILHLLLSIILTRYSLYYTCIIYVFVQTVIVLTIFLRSRRAIAKDL